MAEVITRTELSVNHAINDLYAYKKKMNEYINELKSLKKTREKNLKAQLAKVDTLSEELKLEEGRSESSIQNAQTDLESLNMLVQSVNNDKMLSTSDLTEKIISAYNKIKFSLDTNMLDIKRTKNDLSAVLKSSELMKSIYKVMKTDVNEIVANTMKSKPENRSLSEANALLMMAEERLKAMQQCLEQAEQTESERINEAISYQKQLDTELADATLKKEIDRLKNEMTIQRHNWKRETAAKIEEELANALARHGEQLSQVLKLKEAEMERQFDIRKREIITKEQESFETAIHVWKKRMEAIEKVVEGRADSDRVAKETQAIWLAVESLASAINFSNFEDGSKSGPLDKFVSRILESTNQESEQYRFTNNILASLSDESARNGVWTAQGLRERFEKVYTQCRNVSSIKVGEMSLWTYLKGSLKSFLIFDSTPMTGHDYYLDENTEIPEGGESFSVYRILSSCKRAVNQGNFLLAIRLLGMLEGQAKLVAEDWIRDVMDYLEAQMISKTLITYARAQGHESMNHKN